MDLPTTRPRSQPRMRTHVVLQRRESERAVAHEIADLIATCRAAGHGAVLGLATGGTMRGVYAELVRLHRDEGLDLSDVSTFNLDEYLGLSAGDPRSCRSFMQTEFFDSVNLDPKRCLVPDPELARADPEGYCQGWEQAIQRAGGIDLQLLGLGRNGHVAFNEPGSPRESRTRVVELDDITREDAVRAFGTQDAVPRRAITMGVATILDARRLRVLAFGAHKAEIVRAVLTGEPGPRLPGTWLTAHADLQVWLDRDAAEELPAELR